MGTRARILANYVNSGDELALKAPLDSPTFTGNFTSVGIDDNADATAITIDSSENVGIGISSSIATGLHVYHASTNNIITVESGDIGAGIQFKDPSQSEPVSIYSNGNEIHFSVSGADRMTIDSSSGRVYTHKETVSAVSGAGGTTDVGPPYGAGWWYMELQGSYQSYHKFYAAGLYSRGGAGEAITAITYADADASYSHASISSNGGLIRVTNNHSGRTITGGTCWFIQATRP